MGNTSLHSLFEPYQMRWYGDRSEVKLADKSRRIGFTFATAAEAVEIACDPHGMNVYYMSYKVDTSKQFIRACAKFAVAINNALVAHGLPPILGDLKKCIQTTKIVFLSGFEITYVSHRAENLRGLQGYVILDEFAFLPEAEASLDAAMAHRILGGRVAVVSTHNGEHNPFNRLIQQARAGTFSCPISYHQVTLPKAVNEGFYRRICQRTGQTWTTAKERLWLGKFLAEPRANQEYLCIPDALGSQYFPRTLVQERMAPGKVARLKLDAGFLGRAEAEKDDHITAWYMGEIKQIIKTHYEYHDVFVGHDYADSDQGDVSSMCVIGQEKDMSMRVRLYIEMKGVPFRQQCKIMSLMDKDTKKLRKYVVDAGSNGRVMAQDMPQLLGQSRVEAVQVGRAFYAEQIPMLRAGLEERKLTLVADADIADDFGSVIVKDGIPTIPRIESSMGMGQRHGDSVVSTALAYSAARIPTPKIDYYKASGYGHARENRRFY